MKKLIIATCLLAPLAVFAQDTVPVELPAADLLAQVLDMIRNFGGLPWFGKVAAIITLVLSSMKVSALNDLIWNKLGAFKAWAAPILGLIVGIVGLGADGKITLAGVLAYMSAGAGALILHELLDTIKAIPGIGSMWVSVIEIIKSVLGAKKTV